MSSQADSRFAPPRRATVAGSGVDPRPPTPADPSQPPTDPAQPPPPQPRLLDRLRGWTRRDSALKPERGGEIMTRSVRVTRVDRHLADLVPLFGSSGHHLIPVLDLDDRLAGIITQSDVVAALSRTSAGLASSPPRRGLG